MAIDQKLGDYIDLSLAKQQTEEFRGMLKTIADEYNKLSGTQINFKGAEKTKDVTTGINQLGESVDKLTGKLSAAEKAQAGMGKAAGETVKAVIQESSEVKKLSDYYADLVKQSVANQQATKGLVQQKKDLTAAFNSGNISQEKYQSELEEIRLAEIRLTASNGDLNRALRNLAKEETAAEGSLVSLRSELNLALQAFDRLSREDVGGPSGKLLQERIQELTKDISAQEQATGRFQRNVGNYSGAINILKKSFDEVSAKLQAYKNDVNANKDVVAALEKEYGLLNQLLNTQEAGFANATAEIRANQKALLQMSEAGLQGTAAFQELALKTGQLKDDVADLTARTKALGSDTFVFDGLINAAQGLAGAYGVAQGAATLFGDENEDLQKTFVKLQAVMTVIQGLQAISNTLQAENSAMLLLANVRTRALAAGQALYAFATAGATTATRAFRAALVSTGIGALIVALGYAVSKLMDLAEGTNEAAEKQKKLSEAIKEVNNVIAEQAKFASDVSEKINRSTKDQLALAESRKASEAELLVLRRKVAEEEAANAAQTLKDLDLTENKVISLEGNRARLLEQRALLTQKIQEYTRKGDDDQIKRNQTSLDQNKAEIDIIDSQLVPGYDALGKIQQSNLTMQQNAAEVSAFLMTERQKQMQADRIALQLQAEAFQDTAANEEKSLSDRIAALKNYSATQAAIIKSQAKEQQLDPSLSVKARFLIQKQADGELLKLRTATHKETIRLEKEFNERERAAQFEILKSQINDRIAANNRIIDNDKLGFGARTEALGEMYQNQKSIYLADRDFQLENATLTASEREAIEKQYQSNILDLNASFAQKQIEVVQQNQEAINAAIAESMEVRRNILAKAQSEELAELNKSFIAGAIGSETLAKRQGEIQRAQSIETAQQAVKDAFSVVLATKEGTAARYAAEKELADKTKALTASVADDKKAKDDEGITNFREKVAAATEIMSGIMDVSLTKQRNQIQEQMDALDERTKAEIDAVKQSTDTEEKKAAKIIIIQAKAAADKQALERKQRLLDRQRAEFERANAIMQIILNTAVAVSKDIGNPFKIAFDVALGAAQLAIAVATPLPKFKHGKTNSYEGLGVVGDGGKSELIQREDGSYEVTPDKPTLTYLKARDIVLPDAQAALRDMEPFAYKGLKELPAITVNSNKEVIRAYGKFTKQIVSAIENKQQVKNYITHQGIRKMFEDGNRQTEWITGNTQSR